MAIDTIEEAYEEFCGKMPRVAKEARAIAQAGGVHTLTITTQQTAKRGIVSEMTTREQTKATPHGRFLDLQ